MDVSSQLAQSRDRVSSVSPAAASGCPVCGDTHIGTPVVATSLYPTEFLRRCLHCGRRSTVGPGRALTLASCVECGIPFLTHGEVEGRARCADCGSGRLPSDLPDREVAEASEREIVLALERSWRFVGAPSLASYLERLVGQILAQMGCGLTAGGVTLFDDSRFWTLGLPSGRLLLSLGTLAGLEDEAELAFVLAHELAHASSPDASARLVRLGLKLVAQEARDEAGGSWSDAAHDAIRVGYGRARERDADRRAFRAVVALGYDPRSALSYLRRLAVLVEQGDPRVAELALAHPLPAERLRWLEAEATPLGAQRGPLRVNREVFRRAAGSEALLERLEPLERVPSDRAPGESAGPARNHGRKLWLVASIVVVAVLLAVALTYLT